MAKKSKNQKPQAKAPVKTEKEVSRTSPLTSAELVAKVTAILKEHNATGFACAIVGSDSKILPFAGASSIGDLLTMKYVIEKEISKLIENSTKQS